MEDDNSTLPHENSVIKEENLEKKETALKKDSILVKENSLNRKVNFIRESVSDSGVPERKLSATIDAAKRSSLRSQDADPDASSMGSGTESPRVPRKFISTWKQACDRTKDRTKELLKRWRTLPEGNTEMVPPPPQSNITLDHPPEHNWSVHVWATWVKRYSSDEENLMLLGKESQVVVNPLSSTQKEKLGYFFSHLLDTDRDDLVSEQDFETFSDRLRRFADWSTNSAEFLMLRQVQQGFIDMFMVPSNDDSEVVTPKTALWKQFISLEEWFSSWGILVAGTRNLQDFPVWLQYFPKLIFQAINRSCSGTISRDELSAFYSSMLCLTTQRVGEILDEAYNALTSNGDHALKYPIYRLAFSNFLLGRHPNGPGQYLFGCVSKKLDSFPIDYSALNSQPEDREHYTPDKKSNRVSVVV